MFVLVVLSVPPPPQPTNPNDESMNTIIFEKFSIFVNNLDFMICLIFNF